MKKRTRESERRKWATPPTMDIIYDPDGNVVEPSDPEECERALALAEAVHGRIDEEALRKLGVIDW